MKIVMLQNQKTGKWFWAKVRCVVNNKQSHIELWAYDTNFTSEEIAQIPPTPDFSFLGYETLRKESK